MVLYILFLPRMVLLVSTLLEVHIFEHFPVVWEVLVDMTWLEEVCY